MRIRAALVVTGVALIGFATAGALTDPDVDPVGVLLFMAGALIGHDVLWMAAVLVAGALITRLVPIRWRAVTTAATIVAAAVAVVAFPLVLGYGRPPDNPSALPLPYGRNLLLILSLIVITALLSRLLRRRGRRGSPPPGESRII
jgi:MFS family permease